MAELRDRAAASKAAANGSGSAQPNGADKVKSSSSRDELKLLVAVVGIYGCYMTSAMLQEHIYSYKSPDGGRFSQTQFLLWVQCVVNVIFAGIAMMLAKGSGEAIPHKLFSMAGAGYISAMICSLESLNYINFPTKELGKSCKMIPVMLFGVVFAGKRYSVRDYVGVALITAGIVTFNLAGKHKSGRENSTYGLALLFMSLVLDGVTGSTQDNIKRAHKHTVHEMMFWMNAWALVVLTPMAVLTGQAAGGYAFCQENPAVLRDLFGFALTAALGQNFIYFTISHFSSLVCTTITTTRKFFTILFSVLFFGHPMSPKQWAGVAMVFTALIDNMWSKHQKNQSRKAAEARASVATKTS
eukprot:TRINITY_DN815_c1_g2_i2.p1 TRINITY_DN815_c1_g2~~TRINITY_DN815_c1_g2_i2.p1  ORF type:complete len:356 (-),score=153.18 TRINITY_DN815_c1_g2_i2:376-1443(-)